MKALRIIISLLLLSFSAAVSAQYERLDSLMKEQPNINRQYERNIQRLKTNMEKSDSDREKFELLHQIVNSYLAYRYDSASVYVNAERQVAESIGDISLINQCQIDLVHTLSGAALLPQAQEELNRIDVATLSESQYETYTRLMIEFHIYQAEFMKSTAYESGMIEKLIELRREALLKLNPNSDAYQICKAEVLSDEGKYEEAINILQKQFARYQSGERIYSILSNTIAFYYGLSGDKKKQKEYLILSAQSDIEGSIRENASMYSLATLLFEENDVNRAYHYLQFCINDAHFYGTRLRNLQAATLMPAVITAYNNEQENTHRIMVWMLIGTSVLALIMAIAVVAFIIAYRRHRRTAKKLQITNDMLSEANLAMSQANDELRVTYMKLKERDLVKEEYLARFLALGSQFIGETDKYRKRLLRLQREKSADEMHNELKASGVTETMSKEFYANFDDAFLKIFPDFCDHVNALLNPDAQIENEGNKTLSTELRILALLRLGINQNNLIASILNLGISTVYTYRSRMKARALDHDNFETQIKNILN